MIKTLKDYWVLILPSSIVIILILISWDNIILLRFNIIGIGLLLIYATKLIYTIMIKIRDEFPDKY